MKISETFPISEMVERVARAMWLQRCAYTMRTAGIELESWGEDGLVPLANGIIEEARAAIEAMRELPSDPGPRYEKGDYSRRTQSAMVDDALALPNGDRT